MDSGSSSLNIVINAQDEASDKIKAVGDSLNGITPIGVAVGSMIADLGEKFAAFAEQAIVDTVKLGEQLQFTSVNLDNLTGSSAKTNAMLSQMKNITESGLMPTGAVEEFTQRLIQMGIPQSQVVSLMENMTSASVGSSDSLEQASGKMQTLASIFGMVDDKGEISVSMLSRFSKSLGIPLMDTIKKQLEDAGTAQDTFTTKNKMSADQLTALKDKIATASDALATLEAKHVSGSAATQAHEDKIRSATDAIQAMKDKLDGANTSVDKSTTGQGLSQKAFLATQVNINDVTKAFATLTTGSGEFAKSQAADSHTLEARQQALGNRFDEMKLSILGLSSTGEVVKGGFYDKLSDATQGLINFIDKHKAVLDTLIAAIGIGTVAVALAVVGLIAHTAALGLNTIATVAHTIATTAVTVATGLWTAATWLLNAALIVLTSPIGLVILAIVAIIAIGVLLITHWKEVQSVARTVFTAVGDFFSTLGTNIHNIVQDIINDVKNMVNSIIGAINSLINGANSVAKKIGLGAIQLPTIPQFANGGFVPQTGLAMLHAGEFVLSNNMLAGNQSIPSSVINNTSNSPIQISANINNDTDVNALGAKLQWYLRNNR